MFLRDRAIQVKNDDPSIMYAGNWTIAQASTVNNFGNFGPAFSPTLHSTTTISSLIFPFKGSSINVVGTVNIANSSTNPNPTWQCFLDGINIGSPNIFQFYENNWSLCSDQDLPDGTHELVVNVTSKGMPFYLDYIQYRPSSNVSLEDSLIVIENNDPAIDYISGWRSLGGTANQTTDPKGLVNITFVGTQLSWYGFIPSEESHTASSGAYSIDGQPFSSFQLVGLPQSSATKYYQLFFMTPTLEMGTHMLSAKYTGSPGQTPLTLDFLIVTNGSFPPTGSSPSNYSGGTGGNPTSSPAPSTDDRSKTSSHVRSIVGGVVGAIGSIVICSIIAFFWLKSRKRRRINSDNKIIRRSIIEYPSTQPRFVFKTAPLLAPGPIDKSRGPTYTYQPSRSSATRTSQRFTTTSYSTTSSSNDLVSAYTTDATMDGSLGRPPPSREGSAPV